MLQKSFAEKGYHEVAFAASPEAIQKVADCFFTFLELPKEEKKRFSYSYKYNPEDAHDRGADLGYHFRESSTGFGHDDKEYFHYNAHVREHFASLPEVPESLHAFIQAVDSVYQHVLNTLEPVAQMINNHYQQPFIDLTCPLSVLRILKYNRTPAGEFLARGHYDRNICSLAIAESAPGLRIGPTPEDLLEVSHTKGQAILFPSLMFEDKTNKKVRASWHDVVQKTENHFRPDAARWAMVFFACPNTASPYWNKTLTRTKRS